MKIREFGDLVRLTQDAGLKLSVWWRDDDVFETSKELDRLLHFSKLNDIPAHLSVIPKHFNDDTIDLIKSYSNIKVLQHGYSHLNYAKKGAPLNEFGLDRDIEVMLDEIRHGCKKLTEVFNKQFLPIFVPPWGHIAMPIVECLHEIGFIGISLIGVNGMAYHGLKNMNVQIDVHSWKTESETSYDVRIKSFEAIMDNFFKLISSEKSKQNGYLNIGVLTHSQIMQEKDWEIFKKIILTLKESGVEIIGVERLSRR